MENLSGKLYENRLVVSHSLAFTTFEYYDKNTFRIYIGSQKETTRFTSIFKSDIILMSNYNYENYNGFIKIALSVFLSKPFGSDTIANFNTKGPKVYVDTREYGNCWLYKYGFDNSSEQFYIDFVFTGQASACQIIVDYLQLFVDDLKKYKIEVHKHNTVNQDEYIKL